MSTYEKIARVLTLIRAAERRNCWAANQIRH